MVRPSRDPDAVLAVRTDKYERDAGGMGAGADDVGQVDPLPPEAGQGLMPKRVPPNPGDERHAPARPGRGDRLVGPLSTRRGAELATEQRLPGTGDMVDPQDHVGVGASDDDHRIRPLPVTFLLGRCHHDFERMSSASPAT